MINKQKYFIVMESSCLKIMTQIMEYAYELPKTNMVMETIRLEIL